MRNTPKRFLAIIVCLTVMLALQPAGVPTAFAAAPEWTSVGDPGFSAGVAEYTSLALDSGTPYIAYQDYGNGERATVMKYTGDGGTGWEEVGSPGFSIGRATFTSLAKGSVLATVDAGIMTGYPDSTFRPRGHATRAEAVCVILNVIK